MGNPGKYQEACGQANLDSRVWPKTPGYLLTDFSFLFCKTLPSMVHRHAAGLLASSAYSQAFPHSIGWEALFTDCEPAVRGSNLSLLS